MKNFSTQLRKLRSLKSHSIKLAFIALFSISVSFSVSAKTQVNDSDGDGLSDQYEDKIGTEAYLSDTDGDGVEDGIEVGKKDKNPLDSDGDKRIDALDYDDDNDGLPTFLESKIDTDKDGIKDYLDIDSDNDGSSDGEEAGVLNQDKNLDGVDDAFDLQHIGAIDNNGDGINDNFKLPDYNQDGKPDYLDAKYKKQAAQLLSVENKKNGKQEARKVIENDPTKKLVENKVKEKINKVVLNRYTDSDNDGLLDSQEKILGTNPFKRDSDGDKVSDAIEIGMDINSPQDSDHDKIIDALDTDDDNDGIPTQQEDLNKDSTAINDDTDEDGVPNYLDANDDGDNKLTKDEGFTKDTDKDGVPDYLDKNDGIKDKAPQLAKKAKIPDEPEVVVLFDGDAEALATEGTVDSVDFKAEKTDEGITKVIVNEMFEGADLEKSKLEVIQSENQKKSFETAKTIKERTASHWELF